MSTRGIDYGIGPSEETVGESGIRQHVDRADFTNEAGIVRYLPAWHEPPSRAVPPGNYFLPLSPPGFGVFFCPVQGV